MKVALPLILIALVGGAFALQKQENNHFPMPKDGEQMAGSPKRKDKVVKTEAEWKKILTEEQYRILRGQGTERAFCGKFHDSHDKGVYYCVGCKLPLFRADDKFDSGTGWPSFFQPYAKDSTWTRSDTTYGMIRTEVLCARCDGHLGHVFDDGPKPTNLRFCINSEVLTFKSYEQIAKEKKGG